MIRKIFPSILGIIVGVLLIYLIEKLGHIIYPPPVDLDLNDIQAFKEVMGKMPVGALLFVLLAYGLGSFCGGFCSSFLSKTDHIARAIIVGAFLMIIGLINIMMIPHPLWFVIVSILLYIPCAYIGGKLALNLKSAKNG